MAYYPVPFGVSLPLSELLEDLIPPSKIFDQNFGLGLLNDDLSNHRPMVASPRLHYYRPWRHISGRDSGISNIASNDTEFKVNLDVQQFQPEQLNVKVVDNSVVIQGKHEERRDEHGYISRQFTRRYMLPDSVDPATVVSSLSSDGVLTISAPKKAPALPSNERVVPIIQTQQLAVKSKKPDGGNKAGGDAEKTEKMEQ